jgi:hypothetical protein
MMALAAYVGLGTPPIHLLAPTIHRIFRTTRSCQSHQTILYPDLERTWKTTTRVKITNSDALFYIMHTATFGLARGAISMFNKRVFLAIKDHPIDEKYKSGQAGDTGDSQKGMALLAGECF